MTETPQSPIGPAAEWAAELHADQWRKGKDVRYVSHLFAVCALVLEHGGTDEQAAAALLHDSVEDCGVAPADIGALFGAEVRAMVEACTDGTPDQARDAGTWQSRKEAYLAHLVEAPPAAVLVSLADKVHNARSIADDVDRAGIERLDDFNGGAEGTRWYYRSLLDVFRSRQGELPKPGSGGLRPGGDALVAALADALARFDG